MYIHTWVAVMRRLHFTLIYYYVSVGNLYIHTYNINMYICMMYVLVIAYKYEIYIIYIISYKYILYHINIYIYAYMHICMYVLFFMYIVNNITCTPANG